MTTEVKILNSQHRVEIVVTDPTEEGGTARKTTNVLEPHTEYSFFIFGERSLFIRELPGSSEENRE